jgi:hypothetical protein
MDIDHKYYFIIFFASLLGYVICYRVICKQCKQCKQENEIIV